MLAVHGGAVEADLQRFYGIDLADMYRGLITPRKISVLVMNLPRGAQTWVATGGPQAISLEAESLWHVEHAVQLTAWDGNGKGPQVRDYPPAWEDEPEETREEYAVKRAKAWRQRALERKNKTT